MKPAVLATALTGVVICSAAAAHGGGGALGFRSAVTRLIPNVAGLGVTVLDSDDRLQVRNDTDKPLIILGYEGEPYLAFRDGRVYRNTHSPATYLNDDRYGKVALPAEADPKAPPEWKLVSPRDQYAWHDHRIHWMSRTLPPVVRAAKNEPHHVFNWTVPARLADRAFRISGSLDYQPPPGQKFPKILLLPLAVLVIAGAATIWMRLRRAKRAVQ